MSTPHTVFQDRRLRESAPRLIVLWIAVAVAIINAGQVWLLQKARALNLMLSYRPRLRPC